MKTLPFITAANISPDYGWRTAVAAIEDGHRKSKPQLGDTFLKNDSDTLLSRSAWINGLGAGVKSVTVRPKNSSRGRPTVQGAMLLFDDETGACIAVMDSDLVTYWKTAADSALAMDRLAHAEAKTLVVIGTGTVAQSLIAAHTAIRPALSRVIIAGRRLEAAQKIATAVKTKDRLCEATTDIPGAVRQADIVCTATTSCDPVLRGEWVKPGTHCDLVGAFRADMREADDVLLQNSDIWVDCRETTLDHIGELLIPLQNRTIMARDIAGDFYDLIPQTGRAKTTTARRTTVFKNGGGAHLDVMIARSLFAYTDHF
jgi:ornithine cyclodeaminase